MSKVQQASPNLGDDVLQEKVPSRVDTTGYPEPPSGEMVDMDEYRRTIPLWKRVWRHSLTQMMLLSVQAFCGPAMSDAISGLGGGGLATPETSNIAYVHLSITYYIEILESDVQK